MEPETRKELLARIQDLQDRLDEAEETLRALRSVGVDAVVASGPEGDRVYALKGADEPYRIMVQGMAEGALTVAADGLILFSNEQFASMVGVPLDRVIGASIYSFAAAENAPTLSALLSGGAATKAELQLKKEPAMLAPVQLSASALSLDGAQCVCLIVTDLTEQKRNQESVVAERLARSILDQAAGALVVVDPAGRIIRASRAAEQLVGAAISLRQFDDVFRLWSRSEAKDYSLAEILSTVEREGSVAGIEALARRSDGEMLDVLVSASVLTGADSELLGYVILVSDIGGLKRAEKALRESESRLRTFMDNLPEGAILRICQNGDSKPRFEFITAGIERLTGVPAAEIMRDADAVDKTFRPEDFERLRAEMARSSEQLTRFEIEARHTHRQTGEERWSLLRSMPSRRPDGSTVWDGIQLDITNRKRAEEELRVREEQLRQAQKMESIGVLAGGIAHDFNNLLTGVIGNASLALDAMAAHDRNRPLIEAVMASASRAADLTRQLLAYAGKGRFIVGPVHLSELVRDMVGLLRGSVPATIGIDVDLQQDVPPVEADAGQIQQIIMNLVLNASEAVGDRPGRIAVRTRTRSVDAQVIEQHRLEIPAGTYVCIEVQDNGPGMDEATTARVFEPFFTTRFTGRGLGLAAVHGIARAHKGAVLVYSHPGNGAHFTVLLPIAGSVTSRKAKITAGVQDLYGHGTIVVVDDEETVRTVAKAALEKFGYRVLLARNGIEAVEIFTQAPDQVTVVLLDLTMPLMSGEETLHRLRAIRPDVPVLLSSGYNQIEVIKRFTGESLAGFIGKPYSASTLVGKIKSICDASRT